MYIVALGSKPIKSSKKLKQKKNVFIYIVAFNDMIDNMMYKIIIMKL